MSVNADNRNETGQDNGQSQGTEDATRSTFMHRVQLNTVTTEIVGLIYSVRDLDARAADTAMTGIQVKQACAEMYPPRHSI